MHVPLNQRVGDQGLGDRTFGPELGPERRSGQRFGVLDVLFSIETSFILFLVAGRYKALPEFQSFPVDPTLLFFVLTLGLIVHKCAMGQLKPMPLDAPGLLMLAFCAYGFVSVYWSSLEPKNVDKAWRFVMVSVSGYFLASVLAQEQERRERMVLLMIAFSGALLLYYAYFRWVVGIDIYELENTGRIRGNNYLEYGTHAAYVFYGCLALTVYGPRRWLAAGIAGGVASLFLLAFIGARGPLVFSLLGIPLAGAALFLNLRRLGAGVRRLALLLLVLAVLAWVGYGALVAVKGFAAASEELYTIERLSLQLSNESTSSLDVRSAGRDLAFRRWLEQPLFGWGMGEFRLQYSVLDYPHNLLLEVLMEMGLVGAVLFIPTQIIALFVCFRVVRDPVCGWIDMAIVLKFVTDFVSHLSVEGYLGDNRIYFALLALAIGLRHSDRSALSGQGRAA
ncbi:O-antigen ligase family protein [Azospirillum doebereinerae]|uniref:O-antigen ligase family protein n=1 Tax=Azospirillum doebereinerae TaxID=92933 RepID=A0A433J9V6_9PROT|nr:O-antigen ligase family protein [Azospirillum doebereinerae]RUQ72092.1 O-antigen ligase family protein [Azospirillum doebereinerae]